MKNHVINLIGTGMFLLIIFSCSDEEKQNPDISKVELKRGEVVSCGPADGQLFGSVSFTASVPDNLKTDFNMAIALLHSFEYDESEKVFAKIIDQAPDCAMAYWGVAMSNFHPLWIPPTPPELKKGNQVIQIARGIKKKSKRESDYIEAIAKYFEKADQLDHRTRVLSFEKAMEQIYLNNRDDLEAAIFYALALNAAADPTDQTYARQKKAFSILNPVFEKNPLHPGLAHYIIHSYDNPALAEIALPAAKKYASIAPASAHAQHMPSHIFTRLGDWDECIKSNAKAAASAKCYAEQAKLNGHWDEELHALDYLAYGYLQKGDDLHAKEQLNYLRSIEKVDPITFKTAYAFAAIPARYFLERKDWQEAANYEIYPAAYPWNNFPWEKSIIHFTRVLGFVHTNNIGRAKAELDSLESLHAALKKKSDKAKEAAWVEVQLKASEAWIQFKQGDDKRALQLMTEAAKLEDGIEKHPVTPGEIIPARELLGEMYLQMNKPKPALQAFESNLKTHANRFNSLYGAAVAANKMGNKEKAKTYFDKLITIADPDSKRPELAKAKSYVLN